MLSTEKAIDIETANGSPSGTATITIATPIERNLIIFYRVSPDNNCDSVNNILQTRNIVMNVSVMRPAIFAQKPI